MPHFSFQHLKYMVFLAFVVIGWGLAFVAPAHSQVRCASLSHWTRFAQPPQVNQMHIFCGEVKRDRPVGFHSRPNGNTPNTVTNLQITQPANAQGLYGIRWSPRTKPAASKFSTMFPDRCSRDQVLQSILYAASHPTPCPSGAPNWAWCGTNSPTPATTAYCQANNRTPFVIAGASLDNGNINTAFPLRSTP